ncbi:MAG: restriction endonuclease [Methylobacterium sp.]|nr:restriction endonuclease [Methylobacterium sp.]
MPNHALLSDVINSKFDVYEWRNAIHILHSVHADRFREICAALESFTLNHTFIEKAGGNKSPIAHALDEKLLAAGWKEKQFDTRILIDGDVRETPTHKVDCFKGRVALEVEWNNKDPFFDRDLNNFRLLYDLHVIDLGVIITRSTKLEETLKAVGRNTTTYGKATTHFDKLRPKIDGGGAGGCPVAVFAISPGAYLDDR